MLVVGVGEMKVSGDPRISLMTYSLGSCLGIVVYDPEVRVGGMLHAMLPEATGDPASKLFNPFKFIDTGVPLLFREAYQYGARKSRIIVSVAGGAQIMDDSGFFNIGKRNLAALRRIFWKNGVMIDHEHVEGDVSRTVRLEIGTGRITLRLGWGEEFEL
ncbi:MAG: chemotaxis protein CheD [Candidatus Latescibacterota bacterium]